MRKLVYYVAVTIDGYIAGPGGEFDFFPVPDDMKTWNPYPESIPVHVRELVGIPVDLPNRSWDTVLMGRGTYEPGLAEGVPSPYPHLKQYVFSSTLDPADYPQVEIVDTDPVEKVRALKQEEGLDIWLCGGAKLAGELIDEIDEMVIKSYPVLAGRGIPLLNGRFRPTLFTPQRRQEFSNGTQVTWFSRA
ncbi:dihydrofolate reductase family protein [Nocardia donostiensis]|uniref:Deaminase n=1 Tax=Nocardia donostiensis TaxID=1538463 RepID=A0A1W0BNK9_9NOCA|nr:dihydrofolate reductase family protein [Nocardia donostiensis]ONM47450.1 deaminase [Nocardia donostiensis]OQS24083.1 deaminase [Nocardia donostiensis]